ncbi:organ-specific protein S2-like isoform X7 [Salvia hispanica]|uniref:organ-specific protein S2-like isoform X7 n=1 Tax=Salvia hispanica TaxID=49212 RepID=UPI00200948CF|nr:organ-specific protein S2-like isoform X7 [Salvia hispanica]
MRYTIASFLLLSLIACSVNARKDGGEYWQGVVKDQKVEGNDCHTVGFVREFEPRPSATSYVGSKKEKSYGGHSEPPPNVSAYSDDVGSKKDKSYDGDFEPRPNVST